MRSPERLQESVDAEAAASPTTQGDRMAAPYAVRLRNDAMRRLGGIERRIRRTVSTVGGLCAQVKALILHAREDALPAYCDDHWPNSQGCMRATAQRTSPTFFSFGLRRGPAVSRIANQFANRARPRRGTRLTSITS
jgi:hypothetical protein